MQIVKHGWIWTACRISFSQALVCLMASSLASWAATTPNNSFAGRVALDSDPYTTTTGANIGASAETGEPPAFYGIPYHTVWWSWTAPNSGAVEITTVGSDFDTLLAVYTKTVPGVDSVTNLTLVGGNDDYTNFQSRVVFEAVQGTEYEIQVDGFNGYVGHITLSVRMGPVVSITSPLPDATVMIPPPVTTLSASASAYGNATVIKVEYYADGINKLGQAYSDPYSLVWTNLPEGDQTVTARAIDSGGLTNTAEVTFHVAKFRPPTISITKPLPGTFFKLPDPITIVADAQPGDGSLTKVEFFQGSNSLGALAAEPFTLAWTNAFSGTWDLTAIATDSHGQKTVSDPVSITVTGMPPDIRIVSPLNGMTFGTPGVVSNAVIASADAGTISLVEYFQGTRKIGQATNPPSFAFLWRNPLPSTYSLTAKATTSYGLVNTSAPVNVTVVLSNNYAPVVNLISPSEGSTFNASATITLSAHITDADNDGVARVEFYQNGAKFATSTTVTSTDGTNWFCSLNIGNVLQPGSCALTALAVDSLGTTGAFSAPIHITVTEPTTTEWVACNDDVAGSDTSANATLYTVSSFGTNYGQLRNVLTGENLPVYLGITNSSGISAAPTMTAPAAGTPAAEMFSDYVDFDMGANRNGLEFTGTNLIRYTFTGLSANKVYRFMATAVRGGSGSDYPSRWTKVELIGASFYTPAHSSNVITATQFPASLSGSQAAWNSGVNNTLTTGDIIDWDNIVPGPNGSFTVLCTKYNGLFPGGNASSGTKCYALAAIRLEQTSGQLLVNITKPANGSSFSSPARITVSASVQGLPVPTNVQFYASTGGNPSSIGSKTTPPYSVTWQPNSINNYALTAVARNSAGSITSTVVNVSIVPNTPPIVSIDSPGPGEIFGTVDTIPITAIASDQGGSVTRLEFRANGILLGTDVSNPYSYNWSGMSAGSYVLTAVATDNGGLVTTSAPVTIEVRSGNVLHIYDGPFLQMCTPASMTVCWRTTQPSDSRVHYGTNLSNLNLAAQDTSQTTNHQVLLSGLQPDTRYFYTVETTSQTLAQGSNYFFYTAPAATQPIRIWAIGDTKTGDANERACRDAYYQYAGSQYTDLWLSNGDNAGTNGLDIEFHVQFFGIFGKMLRQTVIYPAIGNHDAVTASAQPYLNIFDLPTQGEAGGEPSSSERYYSYNYANVHFVVLDSTTSDRSTSGSMYRWLTNDLAQNSQDWLIAYWHHAPYSRGNHNSDSDANMKDMRQNFVPVLEAHGVDLVLAGHSHVYERSYLLDGHYGSSSTFNPSTMIKDSGNGRPDGTGPYRKPALGPVPHQGTVYNVVGCTGLITSGGTLDYPAMYFSRLTLGSLVIDINGNRLDAKYLRETGAIDDNYTIIKGSTLRITSIVRNPGAVILTWDANSGQSYQVFRKTNLSPNSTWTPISSTLTAGGSSMTWSDTNPAASSAFYLIERVP